MPLLLNIIRVLDIVYGLIEKKCYCIQSCVHNINAYAMSQLVYYTQNICSGTLVSICIINVIINH